VEGLRSMSLSSAVLRGLPLAGIGGAGSGSGAGDGGLRSRAPRRAVMSPGCADPSESISRTSMRSRVPPDCARPHQRVFSPEHKRTEGRAPRFVALSLQYKWRTTWGISMNRCWAKTKFLGSGASLTASPLLVQLSLIGKSHRKRVMRRVAMHPRAFEPGSRQHIWRGGSLPPGCSWQQP
jgi:hypothetical protein